MAKKPIIGITLDAENDGKYSAFPYLALRENYADCVADAGAAPFMLPHRPDAVAEYLKVLDGLVITGGNFDIDPALYGSSNRHESVATKDRRTRFEWAITQGALDKNIPILGICGGHQLINVMLGGTLLQHIPDDIPNALEHQQRLAGTPQGMPHHDIEIVEGTLLHKITVSSGYKTNSSHHQAVAKLGKGLVVNARTTDGVIEGIEHTQKRFVLGLEWHPEYLFTPEDKGIIAAFVDASM
jgi:putative glutamine amidotransferase